MSIKINTKSLFKAMLGFVALMLVGYAYFFIYSKIKFLSAEIGSAIRAIDILEEKKKEFKLAESNLETHKESIAILESTFFSESNFVDLLNVFDAVAKKAGTGFEAKRANLPDAGGAAEISFTLRGNFGSIAKFLTLLDNTHYSGIVKNLSLFSSEEKKVTLTANIDYLIFNYR